MGNRDNHSIDILLSSYNGADYIEAQIKSILAQTNKNWRLLIRDDGSKDGTVAIIKKYSQAYPSRILYVNDMDDDLKNLGASQSFFKLLQSATADYIMFCDQDDVWLPEKVGITLNKMLQVEAEQGKLIPLLVHTDLQVTDEKLNILASSYYEYRNLNCRIGKELSRLLVQNVVVGCTAMINLSLKNKLRSGCDKIIMHDWWLALIANSFGKIIFLDTPTMLYRQHNYNVAGAKKWSWQYFYQMFFSLKKLKQNYVATQRQAKAFLEQYGNELTHKQLRVIKIYAEMENYSFLKRTFFFVKNRYFMSGFVRNLVILLFNI